jgi:hypothetical protein
LVDSVGQTAAEALHLETRLEYGNKLFALYQGTTSVVPQRAQKELGFSPCAFSCWNFVQILRWQGLKP